ncbi:hypothetical protein [Cellulomonas shaoxiangyii]|uniref:Pilus assembly protein PilO n=1 Tax=Cellulomonas shaoxiangyii TaxID=2566013 RepID=A0A4P7SHZ3_9CELL|nr:hypothetical protein [Cellulomonas shaoxiangyii]QCB93640.1 hypothetical protein E5225_08755 [Cellulomonas shaoxiangyii]TGY84627.1 hypothetical protein E5226_10485 [Cellulomonas shaoxiangyii]
MDRRRSAPWIGGTAAAALALGAGGWFLVVGPARDDTASTEQQVTSTREQNDLLTLQIASLEAASANLDQYKTELAALQEQLPTDIRLSALMRELDTLASTHGVTVLDLTFLTPTELVPVPPVPEAVPAAVPTDPAAAGGEGPAPAEGGAAAPSGPSAPAGMVGMDLTLTVVGTPDAVNAFIDGAQQGVQRLLLVTGVNLVTTQEEGASGGRPATALGDYQVQLSATAYVLPADDPAGAAPAGGADPAGAAGEPGAVDS